MVPTYTYQHRALFNYLQKHRSFGQHALWVLGSSLDAKQR